MITKKALAIQLSKLKTFEIGKIKLEQYQTDSEIASEILWHAHMNSYIKDKEIADFGCGGGIFGIGALLLGAKRVVFIDIDKDALKICWDNLYSLGFNVGSKFCNEIEQKKSECESSEKKINKTKPKIELKLIDINEINEKFDLVVQNPPFGTKVKHADKEFLKTAFKCSNNIYSLHKSSTEKFLESYSKDEGFMIKDKLAFKYPLLNQYEFHKKPKRFIDVCAYLFVK